MDLLVANLLAAVPEPRVFGIDAQTLFSILLQLLNTGILAGALSYLLYKPVRRFMQRRTDAIQARFDLAESTMAEAEEKRTLYEQKLHDIEAEKNEIMESARKFAAEKSAQILDDAMKEAMATKEHAHADVEREYQRVKDGLEKYIIEVSSIMAQKYISHAMDQSTQDRLYAETMAELEEVTWLN